MALRTRTMKTKKGILLTLLSIVILVLMVGELTTYVLLDTNYSQLAMQSASSYASGGFESTVSLGVQGYLQAALPQALGILAADQPKTQVAEFDGRSSYLTVANSNTVSPASQVSMFAWVRPLSQQSALAQKQGSYGMGIGTAGLAPGQFAGYVTGASGTCGSYPFALSPGTWYSVGFTFNGTAIDDFVDGQLYCTVLYTGSVPVSSSQLAFGGPSDSDGYVYGSLADVQLYSSSVSGMGASMIYQRGVGGAPLQANSLVGWWPLAGNVLDSSGSGNNGAPTGIAYNGIAANATSSAAIRGLLFTGSLFGAATNMTGNTLQQYIGALQAAAASQQLSLTLSNASLDVYSSGAYSIGAAYTATATVQSVSSNFTFPVRATATAQTAPSQNYLSAAPDLLFWTSSVAPAPPASTLLLSSSYVPVTLTAAAATPAPFQQMVAFNPTTYGSLENANLGNIRFYQGSTELHSWCESGCTSSSGNAVFWVKLPGGLPSGASIIDMYFTSAGNYDSYAGEAPQLSTTYAQHDNGASVFTFYDNFVGPTLNSAWSTSGCSSCYTASNGLTLNPAGITGAAFTLTGSYALPQAVDAYQHYVTGGSAAYLGASLSNLQTSVSTTTVSTGAAQWISQSTGHQLLYYPSGNYIFNTATNNYSTPQVTTLTESASLAEAYENYANGESEAATYSSPEYAGVMTYANADLFVQWFRIRAYPPNNIMPTVSFGPVQ